MSVTIQNDTKLYKCSKNIFKYIGFVNFVSVRMIYLTVDHLMKIVCWRIMKVNKISAFENISSSFERFVITFRKLANSM